MSIIEAMYIRTYLQYLTELLVSNIIKIARYSVFFISDIIKLKIRHYIVFISDKIKIITGHSIVFISEILKIKTRHSILFNSDKIKIIPGILFY